MTAAPRGRLFLVVGPSGAGKDTLIDAARAARPDIHFPHREITRRPDAGGERLVSVSAAEFAAREAAGEYLLSWHAHDLAYGVPIEAGAALAQGRDVVVNVSRAVVAEARSRLQPVQVLSILAREENLAARLTARGREGPAGIRARLARAGLAEPEGPDVTTIRNDGPLEVAVAAFLAALQPERG